MDSSKEKLNVFGLIALATFGLVVIGIGGILCAIMCGANGAWRDCAMCLIPSTLAFGALLIALLRQ